MIEEFIYEARGKEPSIRSLLVIDESFASGKSVAALLHHLREAGLPTDAEITIAVCAVIEAGSRNPSATDTA